MSISSKAQATVIKRKVTPIILYASDQILTKDVIEDFKKVITYTQDWYKYWLGGKTFACHDIVKIKSVSNREEWIRLRKAAESYEHKRDLYWAAKAEVEKVYPDIAIVDPNKEVIYLTFIYAGDLKDASELPFYSTLAARYTVIEPNNTAAVAKEPRVKFSPKNTPPIGPKMARFVHLLAHELGHCFGLGHTCTDYKNVPTLTCQNDFMEYGLPPYAIMIPQEIDRLLANKGWIY